MSTTLIPPEPPRFTPPSPELGDQSSQSADPVEFAPVLLAQLQDDLSRSRLREAFWISVVVHLVAIIALALAPKYWPGYRTVQVATAEDLLRDKQTTFLELPPDEQKNVTPPKDTKILSDKNRIATSRTPQIDRKTLEELRNAQRQGAPSPPGPPIQQQQQPEQMARMNPQGGGQPAPPPIASSPDSNSALNAPAERRPNPFASVPMSAGSAINQAARNSIRGGGGGDFGDYGLGPQGQGKVGSNVDILSDTQGVDFGPYLSRVVQTVRVNWYNLIPEIARPPLLTKGKVTIEFVIMKDGRVAGMRVIEPGSGKIALDRAAWGGITASNPFAPLPSEFKGPYLALRFRFYYNPDRNEMQ